jgi:hypothetical protein
LSSRSKGHSDPLDCFQSELMRLLIGQTSQRQTVKKKLISGCAFGKGIELRAVADVTEELFRLIRRQAEHGNSSLCRPDQAGHQVHQSRFA